MKNDSSRVGGLGGILLPKAAGRRVARIDERLVAGGERSRVEPLEGRRGHVDLTADFEQRRGRPVGITDRCGHVGDRRDVRRDVLARRAVASRRGADVLAVLVAQAHRQPVELQLADERRHGAVEPLDDAIGPRTEFVRVRRIVEAHHGNVVLDGIEGRDDGAADLLGRRVGRDEIGVLGFDRPQLADQVVVIGVADLGVVERVVPLVVVGDLGAEFVDADGGVSGHRIAPYPGCEWPQAPNASFVEIA